jgi:hypothetical protein
MMTPRLSLRFGLGTLVLLAAACGSSSTPPAESGDDTVGGDTGGTTTAGGNATPDAGGGAKDAGKGGQAGKGGSGGATGGTGGNNGGTGGDTSASGGSTGYLETPIDEPAATLPVVPKCGTPVATAPSDAWVSCTGTLDYGKVNIMVAQPCTSKVVAGLSHAGVYATADAGKTWTRQGDTGGATINDGQTDTILNIPTSIIFDPATPTTFYEAGIYGWQDPWTKGVFITKDDGVTFQGFVDLGVQKQSQQDTVSVDFSDTQRRTILAGGHEQKVAGGQGLFFSSDAGTYFDDIAPRLPQDVGFCTNTLVLDSKNMVVGCPASFSGGLSTIVRTSDGAATWAKVTTPKGAFGHALWASDGTILWPAEGGGMLKSTDLGKTWTIPAGATKVKYPAEELPDGRILAGTSDHVVVSADHGDTWTNIGQALPSDSGFTYSAMSKTLYIWKNGCKTAGWDYTK